MAASYVVVTALAVLLVEAIALVLVLPNLFSRFDLERRASVTASLLAADAMRSNLGSTALTLPDTYAIGDPRADPTSVQPLGAGLVVPEIGADVLANPDGSAKRLATTLALLIDNQSVIRASSYPSRYAIGRRAEQLVPINKLIDSWGTAQSADGMITFAIVPIFLLPEKAQSSGTGIVVATDGHKSGTNPAGKVIVGWAYVQTPGTTALFEGSSDVPLVNVLAALPDSSVGPLLIAGAALLLLLIPVGTAFGIWNTRPLVKRLGTLAAATGDFADGNLARRVPYGIPDEVGKVERGFNEMASRIQAMTVDQTKLVDERARTDERARIARELHDSVSQDLFSVGLIAGGLQRALPASSPLQPEIASMRETIESAMSEMRAMLLELRPALLDERGLASALTDLCTAYRERLGVTIDARIEPIQVLPPADHALLRVAQEGIANAVRHADARHIGVDLARRDGHTELIVADDGRGFDERAATSTHGLGLRIMHERLRELGGTLVVTSEAGRGTRLAASIPA
jgi:signal transduction histidine kinase